MTSIPKKVIERFSKQIPRYKRILGKAVDKDINESDTVTIISDMLCDIFGYDKYEEITSEYAIRNTYCDLAIKVDEVVNYLIEVKSISTELKEPHLRQAINYGANEGIKWVILTNGYIWQVYNIQLKQSIQHEKVFEINFEELSARKNEDQNLLFLLAKEGLSKDVISDYQEKVNAVNKYVIGALMVNSPVIDCMKRELRKMNPGIKVEIPEIEDILKNEVIKRNIIEDDKASEALKRVKKYILQQNRTKTKNE